MSSLAPLRALGGSEICPPDPHCTFPAIASGNIAAGEIGQPFEFQIQVTGNFSDITLIGLPSWATFDPETLLITGTPDVPGTTDVIVLANDACGEGVGAIAHLFITIAANLMMWGNWGEPLPGVFTEAMFIEALDAWAQNAGGYNVVDAATRERTIEFSVPPVGPNYYQILWIPDSLLDPLPDPPLTLTVQNFPFVLQPSNDAPYQDLVIAGRFS
jgi:hypothetical protein